MIKNHKINVYPVGQNGYDTGFTVLRKSVHAFVIKLDVKSTINTNRIFFVAMHMYRRTQDNMNYYINNYNNNKTTTNMIMTELNCKI